MKVGIITFHNGSNYGAALQSFALQEAEKKYATMFILSIMIIILYLKVLIEYVSDFPY